MTIGNHLEKFAGYTVVDWEPSKPLTNLDTTIYRIAVDYEDEMGWVEKFESYLADPNVQQTKGLVLGAFSDEMFEEPPSEVLEAVLGAKDQFPLLDTLFLNDITYEENEISWIQNTDNAALIHAFPKLKHFGTRGGQDLSFTDLNAPELETLIVQTGGLDSDTLNQIITAKLPKLTHLELYLGSANYGGDTSLEDLEPILNDCFPLLTYLGLKDSEYQDDIAKAVIDSPVVKHLEVLDLSLGTLGDEGAKAILDAQPLPKLKHLDLEYHYMSDAMIEQLEAFAKQHQFTINVSNQQNEGRYGRYISISE